MIEKSLNSMLGENAPHIPNHLGSYLLAELCSTFNPAGAACPTHAEWVSREDAEDLVTEHLCWSEGNGGPTGVEAAWECVRDALREEQGFPEEGENEENAHMGGGYEQGREGRVMSVQLGGSGGGGMGSKLSSSAPAFKMEWGNKVATERVELGNEEEFPSLGGPAPSKEDFPSLGGPLPGKPPSGRGRGKSDVTNGGGGKEEVKGEVGAGEGVEGGEPKPPLHPRKTSIGSSSAASTSPADLASSLAASLFTTSTRTRSNSLATSPTSPGLKPVNSTLLKPTIGPDGWYEMSTVNVISEDTLPLLAEDKIVEVEGMMGYFQTLHPQVSAGALDVSLKLAKNDIALASFILNRALTLPPICRHLLAGGCYRSDCTYSHDPSTHTCSFWMRGRCSSTECKFLHGFKGADEGWEQVRHEYETFYGTSAGVNGMVPHGPVPGYEGYETGMVGEGGDGRGGLGQWTGGTRGEIRGGAGGEGWGGQGTTTQQHRPKAWARRRKEAVGREERGGKLADGGKGGKKDEGKGVVTSWSWGHELRAKC